MILANLFSAQSKIHGKGCFTKERIEKGQIVVIWMKGRLLTEKEYIEESPHNELLKRNGVRYAGGYFIFDDSPETPDDFINHSNKPNLLTYCGMLIALHEIEAGEELTADYRFILAEKEEAILDGEKISGYNSKEVMERARDKLLELIESSDRKRGSGASSALLEALSRPQECA